MSKADTQKMLSEAGIDASKVSVLDKGEMVKTEGEFLPILIRLGYGGYRLYRGWSQGSRLWYPLGFGWANRPAH